MVISGTSGRARPETSASVSEVLNRCLDQAPNLEKELLSGLGKDDANISNEGHLVIDWIRSEICQEIASVIGKEAVDGEPINYGTYSISTRGHLFSSCAVAVNDPAATLTLIRQLQRRRGGGNTVSGYRGFGFLNELIADFKDIEGK